MPDRLLVDEDRLFPVQTLFNAISDDSFVRILSGMHCGVGVGINDTHCHFPTDLDPEEEAIEGIRFSLFEDSVVISADELRFFIFKACESHLVRNPDDRDEISNLSKKRFLVPLPRPQIDSSWFSSTVVQLAQSIYDSYDFSIMPILADALQDAGCDSDKVLNHCREPGEHVRGCWVIDLLLGKA